MKLHRKSLPVLLGLLATCRALADDVPLKNWQVPSEEFRKQTDITSPVTFVGIQPCRLVDTRPSQGFPAAWGPPALVMNATRDFDLDSTPHCSGIPDVEAYSLNVTVAEPAGPGDLRMWPRDSPPLVATSIMNWSGSGASFAIANAVIMPAGTSGGVTVQMAGTTGHLIIDINGYYTGSPNPGNEWFFLGQEAGGALMYVLNAEGAASNSVGVVGQTNSNGFRSYGVVGHSGFGISGNVGGVRGTANDSFGQPLYGPAGVRGESRDYFGVLGVVRSNFAVGVAGSNVDGVGAETANGGLACGDTTAVCGIGALSISGSKSFVEPHPRDASKVIKFVSLEGNEAGTYFRGRARFQRGLARIPVPEEFRMVTDSEGLSIQVTPIGEMASVAVVRIDLNEIVVKASRNVEFFYLVQGVRRGYENFTPIAKEAFFAPRSADYRMPESLSAEAKRKLIANGTYNEDGSVNMETAKRLGWTERWKGGSAPAETK